MVFNARAAAQQKPDSEAGRANDWLCPNYVLFFMMQSSDPIVNTLVYNWIVYIISAALSAILGTKAAIPAPT